MKNLYFLLCLIMLNTAWAQEAKPEKAYARDVFRSTRAINGHSATTLQKRMLNFVIGHRFGLVHAGYSTFFGLDEYANYRLGLDYSLTDNWTVGLGRSGFDKYHDVFTKYRLLRQTSGAGFPVTVTALLGAGANGTPYTAQEKEIYGFRHRLYYVGQLLMARRFGKKLGAQLMPTLLHRNLTRNEADANTNWALGSAIRWQITPTMSLKGEYYWQNDPDAASRNAVAFGVNFETYSHVFALQFTNSTGLTERQFLAETTDDFFSKGIHFGFTISRNFRL